MYDDDVQGLDTMGADLAVVGAARGMARRAVRAQVFRPSWLKLATEQGVSTPSEELDVLPFDVITYDATPEGTDADILAGTSRSTYALPQRPFRGERLIASTVLQAEDGAISEASYAVAISPAIYVGAVQVGASQGSLPVSAFNPTAFGVRLSFPTAGQGTRIYIPVTNLITVPKGYKLTLSFTLIGRAVR